MRKKELELIIEGVKGFKEPKICLEQYVTPAFIAADMLWTALMFNDIKGRIVIDLGCGTGRLAVGASLLGAAEVVCVDIDYDALSVADENLKRISKCPYHLIEADVRKSTPLLINNQCTVIMNPPFGVHSTGADMDFVKEALRLCNTVYSLHKLSEGLLSVVNRTVKEVVRSFRVDILKEYLLPIKWFSLKHRRRYHKVNTVFLRIINLTSQGSKL